MHYRGLRAGTSGWTRGCAAVAAKVVVTVVVAAAGTGGCASRGAPQDRMGRAYFERGDYEQAVTAAQQALDNDPDNPRYLDLLVDAQTAAADQHYEQARKLAAAHRPGPARQELDKALGHMPAHPQANLLSAEVNRRLARRDERLEQARTAVMAERWEVAMLAADEARRIDDDHADGKRLFAQARAGLVASHLYEAQQAVDAGNRAKCLELCDKAARWEPDNAFLTELRRRAELLPVTPVAANAPGREQPAETPAMVASDLPQVVAEPAPAVKPVETRQPGRPNTDASAVPDTPQDVAVAPDPGIPQPAVPQPAVPQPAVPQPALAEAKQPSHNESPDKTPAQARVRPSRQLDHANANVNADADADADADARDARADKGPGFKHGGQRLITAEAPATRPAEVTGRPRVKNATFWQTAPVRKAVGLEPLPGRIVNANGGPAGATADGTNSQTAASRPAVEAKRTAANAASPSIDAADTWRDRRKPRKHLFTGTLSRENRRYRKALVAPDGVLIKLRDTDGSPLDADFEIVAGKFKIKPKDVPVNGSFKIRGISGRSYKLTVIWVLDSEETVHFAIDRID